MTISVKDGGTWKEAVPYVKDLGVWKPLGEGWVKEAGVWKKFFPSQQFTTQMTTGTQGAQTGFYKAIFGSISPNITSLGSAEILALYHDGSNSATYMLAGVHSNGGFIRMISNGAVYYRTDATFGQDATRTWWIWPTASSPFLTNPLVTFDA